MTNENMPMKVVLGSKTIKAYVAAPKEMDVMGIVQFGLEYGLLAQTSTGKYVRVNGSTIMPLCSIMVERAIFWPK